MSYITISKYLIDTVFLGYATNTQKSKQYTLHIFSKRILIQ